MKNDGENRTRRCDFFDLNQISLLSYVPVEMTNQVRDNLVSMFIV
ncbi:hypothetical protein SAMN06297397_0272 [Aristaeella lactis]|uniref:Uncharacterized protein n=1 Tax=Aristaeella lactis TaxID=3046383 RepID=A0AC61PHQ3_9FIRM|nr:hypothetical protein SAMN06297397_0272 [Aristaeella lactis]